jgi:two-component system sensor kinase FixL
MGEMVAGLAHELNQPLYAIANYARACQELAGNDTPPRAALVDMTDKLIVQAERAAEIVRRLRRFVSRREPRRTRIDLNALVREVQQLMLFHSHRFAITLKLELDETLPPLQGDAILLEQVLVNLVRNAFEAMSEGQTPNPSVIVTTMRGSGGLIETTVADNGPGFKTESLDQLFEPYYTTKEQGMGLGLVISRSIAEAHGGRLIAESSPSGGAVFRLCLPAEEPARVS